MVYIINIKKEVLNIRLWHYKLLKVLPDKFIVAQWRECIAIKKQWEKGILKHRLVSYVMEHDRSFFFRYVENVRDEMCDRCINFQNKYFIEIMEFCENNDNKVYDLYPEHNNRYLKQCYYNLQEKYDRGIISEEEWKRINSIEEIIWINM